MGKFFLGVLTTVFGGMALYYVTVVDPEIVDWITSQIPDVPPDSERQKKIDTLNWAADNLHSALRSVERRLHENRRKQEEVLRRMSQLEPKDRELLQSYQNRRDELRVEERELQDRISEIRFSLERVPQAHEEVQSRR